jgi:hypothetical protein
MKMKIAFLLVVSVLLAYGLASAGPDDAKWIAQCIKDNAEAKVAPEVITNYCACMTRKMDESETQSVTQWEKTHPTERAECDKESGWK